MVLALLAGCAKGPQETGAAGALDEPATGEFLVPGIRVGDVYRYGFGFKGPTFEASGLADVKILERTSMADGSGRIRDALHVLQSSPDGGFWETYWVDTDTLAQFKRERRINYSEASHFPIEPLRPAPARHASYGNGSGVEELFKEDPLFEDYSFFGGFGSGRLIPDVGGELSIPGYFWLRDRNEVLEVYDNLTGKVEKEDQDETWGRTRQVAFKLEWRAGEAFENLDWTGSFSTQVPLAVDMVRTIKAKIGGRDIDVTFNASLIGFEPGAGEEILRTRERSTLQPRSVEFADFDRAPADGAGPKLLFPLSEALAALDKDPTAIQFFQGHAGAYLQVAHMSETDTCGFGSQPYPGCHWFDWSGRFIAPDDWYLDFEVEKFADASTGAPAYIPYASRDYPFEVIFSAGTPPTPPEQPVVAAKGSQDYPARDSLAAQALTMSGAIAAFKQTAWANLSSVDPNLVVVFVDGPGYGYYMSKEDWVFPSENPELVFFYDEGPLVLERHTAVIGPDGHVVESRNFFPQVTQR